VTGRPPGRQKPPRVLVFNFFAGLKARGIPVYAAELEECFGRLGIEHRELRAPAWLDRAPAALQNVCYVLYEQVVAPLAGRWWRTGLTVYPYNAGSLLDAWTGRAVMVVHDLIPNRRDSGGLAARYIRTCQAWHARLGRPVATVSRHTQRQLRRIERYRRCPLYLWANPFYAFEAALQRAAPVLLTGSDATAQPVRLLLCSGMGSNKDYRGALRLLRQLPADLPVDLRVLGFGDDAVLAERALALLPPEQRARVTVLPRLSLAGIVNEFRVAQVVWVHSRAEGFGRPVVEARMAGRPVVATDIGAFRPLRRLGHVHLYKDSDFHAAFEAALGEARSQHVGAASAESFNRQLEAEVMRLLRHAGGGEPA
jgi:glycosyltransferase involved in cell wall biosynthesis